MRKKVFILGSVFICIAIIFGFSSCDPERSSGGLVSQQAPDFDLDVVQGGRFSLEENRGNVVVMGFWATWCPPCRRKIPHFEYLHNKYSQRGLAVVGVSVDIISPGDMSDFIDQQGISYPIVMGDRELQEKYGGVSSVPTTFIVDKDGMIVEVFIGYRDKTFLENRVKELM